MKSSWESSSSLSTINTCLFWEEPYAPSAYPPKWGSSIDFDENRYAFMLLVLLIGLKWLNVLIDEFLPKELFAVPLRGCLLEEIFLGKGFLAEG